MTLPKSPTQIISPKEIWKQRRPELFVGLLCSLTIIGVAHTLIHRYRFIDSEYAVLGAYAVTLAPQVAGEVLEVLVKENQQVTAGQILCRIDPRPFQAELAHEEALSESLRVQRNLAQKDFNRTSSLMKKGSIDRSSYDLALAQQRGIEQRYRAAIARASIAKINLSRTWLTAPMNGQISFSSARVGMYTSLGFPLFGFIADEKRWVEAKVKETDLSGLRVGDPVTVRFDLSKGEYSGKVQSVAAASETPFASVPDDFAAGNFTKYTQWVPVRISLKLTDAEQAALPVGINSIVQIRRRHT